MFKKSICILLIVLGCFSLAGCGKTSYFFEKEGYVHIAFLGDGETKDAGEISQTEWNGYDIAFENARKDSESNWGVTAGVIPTFQNGDCLLLTPETGVELSKLHGDDGITFSAEIHPNFKGVTDGSSLNYELLDGNGNIVLGKKVQIDSTGEWFPVKFKRDELADAKTIRVTCDAGESKNPKGDYILIKELPAFETEEFVCSATYFGDEWPVNFWSSEMDHLTEDMHRIKEDGFNSIILVIPWDEFQPQTNPVSYNEYAFSSLKRVMEAAEAENLGVYTRIGYTWDAMTSPSKISRRYKKLLFDSDIQKAWYDYVAVMYDTLSGYENFKGGFLTWEDFWYVLSICDTKATVREWTKKTGYPKWVSKNFTLEEYNQRYGKKYRNYESIKLPLKTEPDMEAVYWYYDEFLNTILSESQKYFENLSMEVRIDKDMITTPDGSVKTWSHEATYDCQNADFISLMYGIPTGFPSDGRRISADEALRATARVLRSVYDKGKPVYVEQFLFCDNTPGMELNAQLAEDAINEYMSCVGDIFEEYALGYGIWTYKDYVDNMVYNSQFALDGEGWIIGGDVTFETVEDSNTCRMRSKGSITQRVESFRDLDKDADITLSFTVPKCREDTILKLKLGNETQKLEINAAGDYECSFKYDSKLKLELKVLAGDMNIDNIRLYTYVQKGRLYDINSNECDLTESIRSLNARLCR